MVTGAPLPQGQVVEIQRARLLRAAVSTVDELGYTRATVANITHRARVSRRTFYELFTDRETCLLAVMDDALQVLREELDAAEITALPWREQVRVGLSVILSFCDREPALARLCVVHALRGGNAMLERREQVIAQVAAVIDEGRSQGARGAQCTTLTAEGLAGAALAILYSRLLRRERESLIGLLGELTAMILLPYLGPAAARREQARPAPAAGLRVAHGGDARATSDPFEGLAMRMTYRTARALEGIAEQSGVSNRWVAEYAGINDQGQVSKLLARLERLGLLTNKVEDGHSKGEPNAWSLTPRGQQLALSMRRLERGEQRVA